MNFVPHANLRANPSHYPSQAGRLGTGQSGQAPGRTPARLEAGARQLLDGPHALAEGQAEAGTIPE
ncbi:MAG: hypothetical protein NT154_11905 [Verrucomicrobia bacterium]|nr:hypothetical protein [Verrucomicrobiota bacterium]